MKKALIAIGIFLLIGALMIKEQAPDKKSFASGLFGWVLDLFGNVRDLTGHAISDYTWLPKTNQTSNTSNLIDNPTNKKR